MTWEDELITNEDKQHLAYGLCVLGVAGTGAALGSMAGGQTLLGAAGGAVVGLFMCKSVERPLKKALFSSNGKMSEREFRTLLTQTRRANPSMNRQQILNLIAASRIAATKEPWKYRS